MLAPFWKFSLFTNRLPFIHWIINPKGNIKNIKEYYDTYCKFDESGAIRTDPINKDLKKHLSNIFSVVDAKADDFDPYQV